MLKYVTGAIVIIIVIIGGFYLLGKNKSGTPAENTAPAVEEPQTNTYSTSTFSVSYPADFTVDDLYEYTQVDPKKPISGVKFTIPETMATGTNLAVDTYVSIEELPRARNCTGDIYLADNVKSQTLIENGVEYSVATTTGAATGNVYEEAVFAIAGSKPCTAVRYFIHSGSIANYDPATGIGEFDRSALISAFDAIRSSLILTSGGAVTPESTTPAAQ